MQGFQQDLFQTFLPAEGIQDVVQTLPEGQRVPMSLGSTPLGPEHSIITPNALREAQLHFGCPDMDKVLLGDDARTTPPEHWSLRHYNVSTAVTVLFRLCVHNLNFTSSMCLGRRILPVRVPPCFGRKPHLFKRAVRS